MGRLGEAKASSEVGCLEKRWQIRKVNEACLRHLAGSLSLPPVAARILLNRGIVTPEAGQDFLAPSLKLLSSLEELPGISKGLVLLEWALRRKSRILVFGDYDVDGLTASSILGRFLRRFSENVEVYIPSRFTEGYGLTERAASQVLAKKPHLVIAVDCGVRDVEGARILKRHGVGLIILDHHLPNCSSLPEADAIVSTWDLGTGAPLSILSGAGLALVFVRALALYLGVDVDPAEEYLDLACLGTVGDAVPLLRENRVIAKYGLALLNRRTSLGVQALLEVSGLGERSVDVNEVSFILAPRINAAGRMDHPGVALELLLCEDYERALHCAQGLNRLNSQRQEDEEKVLRDILEDEGKRRFLEDEVVVLSQAGWNVGVLGIVASRLSERFVRPVIVLGEVGRVAVGSGRSIEGFNLTEALGMCAPFLLRYGGHEMAAGLRVRVEDIPLLREKLNALFAERIRSLRLSRGLVVDAVVGLSDIDEELVSFWEKLKPFGEKNPNPLFATLNVALVQRWMWGRNKNHIRFLVRQGKEWQEVVVFGGKERAGELFESSLADLAFEVQRDSEHPFYLKVQDWRVKK